MIYRPPQMRIPCLPLNIEWPGGIMSNMENVAISNAGNMIVALKRLKLKIQVVRASTHVLF